MKQSQVLMGFLFILQLILAFNVYEGLASGCSDLPPKVIRVSKDGEPNTFKTIQAAIETVPSNNSQWIGILIPAGVYSEKIVITAHKTCILLKGAGRDSTIIQWSNADTMETSATFTAEGNDFAVMGITFKNTYNIPIATREEIDKRQRLPAVAAKLSGDRSAFFQCAFLGMQDTLYDHLGRHYFHMCNIQGEVDFIFGNGQSIYEECVITFADNPAGLVSFITAQNRKSMNETTGYVFRSCTIEGNGQAYLGRAYGPFSRVIILSSNLTSVIYPKGWFAWGNVGHEANLTYVEEGNTGPGADQSQRVPWMKKLDTAELNQFMSNSYIDNEGWLPRIQYLLKNITS